MSSASQPVTREDLDRVADRLSVQFSERLAETAAGLRAGQEAAVAALTANLSDLREELRRRLDRVETNLTAIQMQTLGMSKSLTDAERLDGRMLDTQFAQQRAIDDLAKRVANLERRSNPSDR